MSKFSKMFDKDSVCDDYGWGGGLYGWLGDKNRGWKNWTNVFWFFWLWFDFFGWNSIFSVTIFVIQFLSIAIVGPSNLWFCVFVKHFWELIHSQKCLMKMQHREFKGSAIVIGGRGVEVGDKNCGQKKNENVGRTSKKTFFARKCGGWARKHKAQRSIPVSCMQSPSRLRSRPAFLWRLPTFNQTGWQNRSALFYMIKPIGLSSTRGILSCSTRPLDQAAPPIRLANWQCGCALMK